MKPQPWTIRRDAPLAQAHRLMHEHDIRHLPVLDNGQLVGVVSERDLHLVETLRASDPAELTVEHAMVKDVFTAPADAPVAEVVEQMAARKIGSAIALDRQGKVTGIFTTVDALQFFADVLRRECD
jgi:acetoin utilization protein AcuB